MDESDPPVSSEIRVGEGAPAARAIGTTQVPSPEWRDVVPSGRLATCQVLSSTRRKPWREGGPPRSAVDLTYGEDTPCACSSSTTTPFPVTCSPQPRRGHRGRRGSWRRRGGVHRGRGPRPGHRDHGPVDARPLGNRRDDGFHERRSRSFCGQSRLRTRTKAWSAKCVGGRLVSLAKGTGLHDDEVVQPGALREEPRGARLTRFALHAFVRVRGQDHHGELARRPSTRFIAFDPREVGHRQVRSSRCRGRAPRPRCTPATPPPASPATSMSATRLSADESA